MCPFIWVHKYVFCGTSGVLIHISANIVYQIIANQRLILPVCQHPGLKTDTVLAMILRTMSLTLSKYCTDNQKFLFFSNSFYSYITDFFRCFETRSIFADFRLSENFVASKQQMWTIKYWDSRTYVCCMYYQDLKQNKKGNALLKLYQQFLGREGVSSTLVYGWSIRHRR